MVNSIRFFLLPLAILTTTPFFHSSCLAENQAPKLKIGALLSFSGGLEQWCSYIRHGMDLAIKEAANSQVEIIYEDDQSINKREILSAAHKLININKVDLLFSWTTSTTKVLRTVTHTSQTPLIIGAYDQNIIDSGPFTFGAFVNLKLLPREIANFLVKKLSVKKLGLVLAADEWSQSFQQTFVEQAELLGAKLVLQETLTPDEEDTRALSLKIKKSGVEALLAPLYGKPLFSLLKTLRSMKYKGYIHVADGMFEEDLKLIGTAAEGVYASQIWLDSSAFKDKYSTLYKHELNPLQLGLAATGYDIVRHLQLLAIDLTSKGIAISPKSIATNLKTFSSQGYLGEVMLGNPPATAGEIHMLVKGGRYIRVEL